MEILSIVLVVVLLVVKRVLIIWTILHFFGISRMIHSPRNDGNNLSHFLLVMSVPPQLGDYCSDSDDSDDD